MKHKVISLETESLAKQVVNAAFAIHSTLGAGLLESVYEECMAFELKKLDLKFEKQKPMPVTYKDITLDAGYRIDFLVDDQLIVELKATDGISPIHQAQILTYMKLSDTPLGLLINFNVPLIKDGIKRFIL